MEMGRADTPMTTTYDPYPYQTIINLVQRLAPQMRTGLIDPASMEKLHAESDELTAALDAGDQIGALMEAADCCYYAGKAYWNSLLWLDGTMEQINHAVYVSRWTLPLVILALETKYECRIAHGKDDAGERAAVEAAIQQLGVVLR
jgi:hypothetical protein